MEQLEAHPAAEIFAMYGEDALAALVESVREFGLWEPIRLYEGKVLDGRNRLRACHLAGVEPRFEDVSEDEDPVALVALWNAQRRESSPDQKAMAAAEAWPLYEGRQGGDPRQPAESRQVVGNTRDVLARMFGVGRDRVETARKLLTETKVDTSAYCAAIKNGTAGKNGISDAYTKMLQALRESEHALEQAEKDAARAKARYDAILRAPTPEIVAPLTPEEVSVSGADIAITAARPADDIPKLDHRPEVERQLALLTTMTGIATRLQAEPPVLPDDSTLDVCVLAARDAVSRITNQATAWLRDMNALYTERIQQ